MKFDASKAVEALEIDLSKYDGPVGVIPEPSDGQVKAFMATMREIAVEVRSVRAEHDAPNVVDGKIVPPEELQDDAALQEIAELSEEQAERWNARTLEALAAVT